MIFSEEKAMELIENMAMLVSNTDGIKMASIEFSQKDKTISIKYKEESNKVVLEETSVNQPIV